jgi:hypothetical protein
MVPCGLVCFFLVWVLFVVVGFLCVLLFGVVCVSMVLFVLLIVAVVLWLLLCLVCILFGLVGGCLFGLLIVWVL